LSDDDPLSSDYSAEYVVAGFATDQYPPIGPGPPNVSSRAARIDFAAARRTIAADGPAGVQTSIPISRATFSTDATGCTARASCETRCPAFRRSRQAPGNRAACRL